MWKSITAVFLSCFLSLSASAIQLNCSPPHPGLAAPVKIAHITHPVTPESAINFTEEVLSTLSIPGPRLILIDSPGGEIEAGDAIIKTMKAEKSAGILQICFVHRYAASMAFNIFTHCDVRLASPNARFVAHAVAISEIDCRTRRCTAKRLSEYVREAIIADRQYRRDNAKALGLSPAEYDIFADGEYVWTVDRLLKLHYLHGICTSSK